MAAYIILPASVSCYQALFLASRTARARRTDVPKKRLGMHGGPPCGRERSTTGSLADPLATTSCSILPSKSRGRSENTWESWAGRHAGRHHRNADRARRAVGQWGPGLPRDAPKRGRYGPASRKARWIDDLNPTSRTGRVCECPLGRCAPPDARGGRRHGSAHGPKKPLWKPS